MSGEEMLLRKLVVAGHPLCLANLSSQEQAAAERLQEMGFLSFDACVVLTVRGREMIASMQAE